MDHTKRYRDDSFLLKQRHWTRGKYLGEKSSNSTNFSKGGINGVAIIK